MELFLVLAVSLLTFAGAAAAKPNFLLILTEDHGYGDVTTYGASNGETTARTHH